MLCAFCSYQYFFTSKVKNKNVDRGCGQILIFLYAASYQYYYTYVYIKEIYMYKNDYIQIYKYNLYLYIYRYTRILGPPEAGHKNKQKTLIRMNVYLFEKCGVFKQLDC